MSFVDEVTITLKAGNGGAGSASFRREKFIPFGGPDGGDGGHGGSIIFIASNSVNTLIDFRYMRTLRAAHGDCGHAKQCTGRSGEDVIVRVPVGTLVTDADTQVTLADLTEDGQEEIIVQGGKGGLGNTHFKTSTNRAPRKTTLGTMGESVTVQLELKLLADVGLVGLPNAGKSTLIRAVSAAKPKVANYPFTTLKPHLGVVRISEGSSFVMADIPGLVRGAADGAGLGHQFLRHIQRTHLLLHVLDIQPYADYPYIEAFEAISHELEHYEGADLIGKPRWLVLNKIDLVPADEREGLSKKICEEIKWDGPVYTVSAANTLGTSALVSALAEALSELKQPDL